MIVTERFTLSDRIKAELRRKNPKFGFGLLGAAVYYRTYSRIKENGEQEQWADTVIRVVENIISIRKWWYVTNGIEWDEKRWSDTADHMARAIFDMKFLPPGRGLWALSDYTLERGGLALNNCQFRNVTLLSRDSSLIMDSLMLGVGVGFGAFNYQPDLQSPDTTLKATTYIIPDTREGWVDSLRLLIESYERGSREVLFDYHQIRPQGAPIKGFGGVASGPEPLRALHKRTRKILDAYVRGDIDQTRMVADVVNSVGTCVVAGNVRRSAELFLGSPHDSTFLNLKNYDLYPDRQDIGWMSNNSVRLTNVDDFKTLPDITERIIDNGEPGVINLVNIQQYGRYSEKKVDTAIGTNPCAEATLENAELCNLVEVFPTRCKTQAEFFEALNLATIYASTISLMPIHQEDTHDVVARNRRIGVSLSGIADWFDTTGIVECIKLMRRGYRLVEYTNNNLAWEAKVPPSIRLTVVKPSGTVSQLAGVSSGLHYPPFKDYIRRVRVGENTPIVPLLQNAGVPYEEDIYSNNTLVFEFPISSTARRSQRDLTIWQKGMLVTMLQRHWTDQMPSNTLTFDPHKEAGQLEDFLGMVVPQIKSISLLPDDPESTTYEQMPYEARSLKEIKERKRQINEIDWTTFGDSDGEDSRFCTDDGCEIIPT